MAAATERAGAGNSPRRKSSSSFAELEETNKKLRESLGSKQKGGLGAYAQLPGNTRVLDVDYGKGWTYKSRELASDIQQAPVEIHGKRRRPSNAKGKAASSSGSKDGASSADSQPTGEAQAGQEQHQEQQQEQQHDQQHDQQQEAQGGGAGQEEEEEDENLEEEFDLWALASYDQLMEAFTDADTGCKGVLTRRKLEGELHALMSPADAALLQKILPDEDHIDYADFAAARKARGLALRNKKRGCRGGSVQTTLPKVTLDKAAAGKGFDQVKSIRSKMTEEKAKLRKAKEQEEFEYTTAALSKLGTTSGSSKNLKDALMTYSSTAGAKRAVKKADSKTKKKPASSK